MQSLWKSSIVAFALLGSLTLAAPVSDEPDSAIFPIKKDYTNIEIHWGNETRSVAYWVTKDGRAIIDGDIVYGTEAEIQAARVDAPLQPRAHSIIDGTNPDPAVQPWPNAIVFWTYDDPWTTGFKVDSVVQGAINNWKSTHPWLTFQWVASGAAGDKGIITIKSVDNDGCHSDIGFHKDSPMTINLQTDTGNGACGIPEATHEFGHALGLLHEAQRPDASKYLTYNPKNLAPACKSGASMPTGVDCSATKGYPIDKCCLMRSNFGPSPGWDAAGSYDIGSLMQYPDWAFAIPGKKTLTGVGTNVVPTNNIPNPTTKDADRICKIYKNDCPKAKQCKEQGCPANCSPISTCTGAGSCRSDFPPPCCDPSRVAACKAKYDNCSKAGCNFLFN